MVYPSSGLEGRHGGAGALVFVSAIAEPVTIEIGVIWGIIAEVDAKALKLL